MPETTVFPHPPCFASDVSTDYPHGPIWSHRTHSNAPPRAQSDGCNVCTTHGGWTNEFKNEESNALVVHGSLTFSKACAPLLGGHPPAIHPVPDADFNDSATVHNLVHTVNLILTRLRSCGVLASHHAAHGQKQFQKIGMEQNTFGAASQDCISPYTVTQAAVEAYVNQNPLSESAPVLRLLLQLWSNLPDSQFKPIDSATFTRLFVQARSQLQARP